MSCSWLNRHLVYRSWRSSLQPAQVWFIRCRSPPSRLCPVYFDQSYRLMVTCSDVITDILNQYQFKTNTAASIWANYQIKKLTSALFGDYSSPSLILISFSRLSSVSLCLPSFWIPTRVSDGSQGLSWDLKSFDKGMQWTESYLPPRIAFQWMLSLWETVRPLCCVSGEAYHFTPTCRLWPAHGPQNKTLSVCSSAERGAVCAWPERGLCCCSIFNLCHLTF